MGERTELSDEELMMAYGNDDIIAFEILYKRHRSRAFGFILSKLKDHIEAEEVFQTAFIKLHLARTKYRAETPFLAWLFVIIRNVLIDHQRKASTYQKYLNTAQQMSECYNNRLEEEHTAELSPEIFSNLSEVQRQAIELRFNQGLTFTEIASQLKTSSDNSRQIISRAIRRLRDLLSNEAKL